MEVLAGARYLWLKPELELDITGPLHSRDKKTSDSGDEDNYSRILLRKN